MADIQIPKHKNTWRPGNPNKPKWFAIGASVIGASHQRTGKPNQDAIAWRPLENIGPPLVLAISDGHGSDKCFRSHIGSRLAVDIATSMLEEFFTRIPSSEVLRRLSEVELWLTRKLVQEWIKEVNHHLAENPFTEDELQHLLSSEGEHAVASLNNNPIKAYGATLLASIVIPEAIVLLQLGDGDILCVSDDGYVWRPIPSDDRLMANVTTSLCMPDAWKEIRINVYGLAGKPPSLILLSTDGYSNSFASDDAFTRVGFDLLQLLRKHGDQAIADQLPSWLSKASSQGSGDDISVGMIARLDALRLPAQEHPPIDEQPLIEPDGIVHSGENPDDPLDTQGEPTSVVNELGEETHE